MGKKVVPFNRSFLEEFLNAPGKSEFIINMSDIYRNMEDHLKVCDRIAKDVFGEDVIPEAAVTVHNVIMDFLGAEGEESLSGIKSTEGGSDGPADGL